VDHPSAAGQALEQVKLRQRERGEQHGLEPRTVRWVYPEENPPSLEQPVKEYR
jgi:hypothetical protein